MATAFVIVTFTVPLEAEHAPLFVEFTNGFSNADTISQFKGDFATEIVSESDVFEA